MFTALTDTERQEQINDEAAFESRLDGCEAAYRGLKFPQDSDWAYLQGFGEGLKKRNEEMLEQVQYLKEMSRKTDLIVAGHCDWLNELHQGNDEPWLADEARIEEF